MTDQENNGMTEIIIKGNLTAPSVSDLKAKIQEQLDRSPGVRLEFRDMEDCDSLGVQMLISAGKTARAQNKSLVLSGVLAPVLDMTGRLGLDHELYFTLEERSA